MYELLVFILLSVILECGMGIFYGIGVGYDPLFVFPAAIILNFIAILVAVFAMDKIMNWQKGFKNWVERRLSKGQKYIDRYGCIGIIAGIMVLSPIQLALVGKMLGMKPGKLYPALLGATFIVATAFLAAALGIFKVLLS